MEVEQRSVSDSRKVKSYSMLLIRWIVIGYVAGPFCGGPSTCTPFVPWLTRHCGAGIQVSVTERYIGERVLAPAVRY